MWCIAEMTVNMDLLSQTPKHQLMLIQKQLNKVNPFLSKGAGFLCEIMANSLEMKEGMV